jgi:hypothetical protein
MERTTTERGFSLIRFQDSNGVACNIQKSSSAMEDKIWIGASEIGLKQFIKVLGWTNIELPNTMEHHFIANNQMHLTRAQVAQLLPVLQKFVDTGEI